MRDQATKAHVANGKAIGQETGHGVLVGETTRKKAAGLVKRSVALLALVTALVTVATVTQSPASLVACWTW